MDTKLTGADGRDFLLVGSLAGALDLLSGEAFDDAIPLFLGHVEAQGHESELLQFVPAPSARPAAVRRGSGR